MIAIQLQDLFLFPLYALLLHIICLKIYKIYFAKAELKRYFFLGLYIKILFALLFALFSVFLLPGDTQMYYTSGIDFRNFVMKHPGAAQMFFQPAEVFGEYYELHSDRVENYGYVAGEGNFIAIRAVALLSSFCFDSYLTISLLFSFFSFLGLWAFFKVFHKIFPQYPGAFFSAFFLIPSLTFWGSGILKDTLCIGFLGIGFFYAHKFFIEHRYRIRYLAILLVSFFLLYLTKSYIAYAFIPSFLLWHFFNFIANRPTLQSKLLWIFIPVFAISLYLIFADLNSLFEQHSAEMIVENIEKVQKDYERSTPDDGALIDYGEISPTPRGILNVVPKALTATLFRPFLWEANKATALVAALEGAFFFLFTLYAFIRGGFLRSFIIIFSNTTVLFTLVFSLVFAVSIGLNCFNLGTLVRYKIPCLPFYFISLTLILNLKLKKT